MLFENFSFEKLQNVIKLDTNNFQNRLYIDFDAKLCHYVLYSKVVVEDRTGSQLQLNCQNKILFRIEKFWLLSDDDVLVEPFLSQPIDKAINQIDLKTIINKSIMIKKESWFVNVISIFNVEIDGKRETNFKQITMEYKYTFVNETEFTIQLENKHQRLEIGGQKEDLVYFSSDNNKAYMKWRVTLSGGGNYKMMESIDVANPFTFNTIAKS